MLDRLRRVLGVEAVPGYVGLPRSVFERDTDGALLHLRTQAVSLGEVVMVRSSAHGEDAPGSGTAGRYRSIPNVPVSRAGALERAVAEVFTSMAEGGGGSPDDVVFVQRMFKARLTAVVLTSPPCTRAPYFVVAYSRAGSTSAVTEGAAEGLLHVLHSAWPRVPDPALRSVLSLADGVRRQVPGSVLDLEIVLDMQGSPRLLQARALGLLPTRDDDALERQFLAARRLLRRRARPGGTLLGSTCVLSDMADWNPAEIIGLSPRPLAWSLYQAIIGSWAWSEARSQLGYRTVRRQLFVRIGTHPYVDVRASLSSLVPALVPPHVADAIVTAGLHALTDHPDIHNRIEMELSTSPPGLGVERLPAALHARLSSQHATAAADAGAEHTARLLQGLNGPGPEALLRTFRLPDGTRLPPAPAVGAPLGLYVVKTVIPVAVRFAAAARHAFVATRLLDELVASEALSPQHALDLRAAAGTVAIRFQRHLASFIAGTSPPETFERAFGHLRAGTYDIRAPAYRDLDLPGLGAPPTHTVVNFKPTPALLRGATFVCRKAGLSVDAERVLNYISTSICAREEGKYVLSWYISALLDTIAALGTQHSLDRDHMSFLSLGSLMSLHYHPDLGRALLEAGEASRAQHYAAAQLVSGPVVCSATDLSVAEGESSQPTFITDRTVEGPVVVITPTSRPSLNLRGAIVCAERLDPGFEWLFSSGAAGLVVLHSGPNSHVAVRCYELGLPAVLGGNRGLFLSLCTSSYVRLDCGAGTIGQLQRLSDAV